MSTNEKQYTIVFWETASDGSGNRKIKRIPTTKEEFNNYYRPITAYRRTAQNHGRCECPESKRLLCNIDCGHCPYATAGDISSLDETYTNSEGEEVGVYDYLQSDEPDIIEELAHRKLLKEMRALIDKLGTEDKQLCQWYMDGKSECEMASALHISQPALNKRKKKLFDAMKAELEKFL